MVSKQTSKKREASSGQSGFLGCGRYLNGRLALANRVGDMVADLQDLN
jgi:hypothetical protein